MSFHFDLDDRNSGKSQEFATLLKWGAAVLRPYMNVGGWD
jgi:hypothetical protein